MFNQNRLKMSSKKATTKIIVDTDKLRGKPAGKIEDRSIIVMKDTTGATDYSYENPTDKDFKDKLVQLVDKDADREWTIEALNGKDDVSFTGFDGPDALNLYIKTPEKDGKNKMKTKVKGAFSGKVNIWYTFKIEFEGKVYFWDPADENRPPYD